MIPDREDSLEEIEFKLEEEAKPKYVILKLSKENTVQLSKVPDAKESAPDVSAKTQVIEEKNSSSKPKFVILKKDQKVVKIDDQKVFLVNSVEQNDSLLLNPPTLQNAQEKENAKPRKILIKSGDKFVEAEVLKTATLKDPSKPSTDSKQNIQWERKLVTLSAKSKEAIEKQTQKAKSMEKARGDKKKFNEFRCEECDLILDTSKNLFLHKRSAHMKQNRNENRTCSYCGKLFKTVNAVQKHENKHKGVVFPCEICKKQLSTKHQLSVHMRYHTGEYTHKCEECGKEYYNNKAFRQHMEAEHKGIRYMCEYCPSVLRSKRYWKDHMAKHVGKNLRPFKCDVCNKFYSSKSALNGHMKIHTGEKFDCDICGKKSTQRAAHIIHMRLHSGEKDYVCEVCGKGFIRKDMMTLHIRRVHELYQFPCPYCEDKFNTRYQLEVHLHDHDEVEKRFECQICSQKFTNNNFLRTHINKVHIDKVADHEFGGKRGIRGLKTKRRTRERKKPTKEAPFEDTSLKCRVCDTEFENLLDIKRHLRLHLKTIKSEDEQDEDEEYIEEFVEEVVEFEDFTNSDSIVEVSPAEVIEENVEEEFDD